MSAPLPILVYHSVSDHVSTALRRYSISPARFRAHLDLIAASEIRVVTVSTAVERLSTGFSEPIVALSFDDAFADFAEEALPALREHGMPATLYVPTAYIGSTAKWLERETESPPRMMSWAQLREAAAAGIELGAHSHSHLELDRLDPETLALETERPKALLEQELGREVRSFAYPFGYHSGRVRRAVRDAGYSSACAVGNLTVTSGENRFALSRWTVADTMGPDDLRQLLSRRTSGPERAITAGKRLVWQSRRRWLPRARALTAPVVTGTSERTRQRETL